ncbi:hypothetical protein FACS1894126_1750 [Alphaproteobacteria bacterium]|nr:hypothetical protein FACS1894126_1750 [Alphaproteobacteria bacterium]
MRKNNKKGVLVASMTALFAVCCCDFATAMVKPEDSNSNVTALATSAVLVKILAAIDADTNVKNIPGFKEAYTIADNQIGTLDGRDPKKAHVYGIKSIVDAYNNATLTSFMLGDFLSARLFKTEPPKTVVSNALLAEIRPQFKLISSDSLTDSGLGIDEVTTMVHVRKVLDLAARKPEFKQKFVADIKAGGGIPTF